MRVTKFEERLKELETIGKEWADFSAIQRGAGWHTWRNETVEIKCYLADNTDHKAVSLGGINIGFFSPVHFELRLHNLRGIEETIKYAKAELQVERDAIKALSDAEAKRLKQERIDALKQQLSELES